MNKLNKARNSWCFFYVFYI